MRSMLRTPLFALAGVAALYAYFVADSLVREHTTGMTWVDAGTLFVMGLIVGLVIGLAVAVRPHGPDRPA